MGATDSGVSTKFEKDYEAIVAAREKERAEENPEVEETEEPEEVEEEPEEPMIDLVAADGSVIRVPASARYIAKVDGEQVEVPFDQITRSYQKGAAADKRLEEASTLRRSLEEKESELTRREQAFVNQQKALEQKREQGSITDNAYRDKAKKLLAALTDEDETDPEGRIASVLSELTNPEEIVQQAEQRALGRIEEIERQRALKLAETERLEANQRFEKEYEDVVKDPIAYMAARKLAEDKWAQKPNATPWEIADLVGKEIRGMRTRKPATLKTVSARAAIGHDEKIPTREDIIKQMRLSRGQP